MPSAYVFATQAAFVALNDDRFGSADYQGSVIFSLANLMMMHDPRAGRRSDAEKQAYNDVATIFGVTFLVERQRALQKHDRAGLKVLRSQARFFLQKLWHIDPDHTHLDDLVCLGAPRLTTCEGFKYFVSHGTRGSIDGLLSIGRR